MAKGKAPDDFMRLADAVAEFGFDASTIVHWRHWCPALDRPIDAHEDPQRPGWHVYRRSDLAKASAFIEAAKPVKAFGSKQRRWVWGRQLEKDYGIPSRTLGMWAEKEKGCPLLDGRKLQRRKRLVACDARRPHYLGERHYFLEREVAQIVARRERPGTKGGWLTAQEAFDDYGVSPWRLWNWTWQGCPYLNGRKIKSTTVWLPKGDKTYEYRLYLKSDVEDIKSRREARDRNADVNWLAGYEAEEEFGWMAATLEAWRRRGCTYLGGRKLNRDEVRRVVRLNQAGNLGKLWVYSRDVLQRIKDAQQKGGSSEDIWTDPQGVEWLSPDETAGVLKVTRSALDNWRVNGCPFGELHTTPSPFPWRGCAPWFLKQDVDAIKKEKQRRAEGIFKDEKGRDWLTRSAAKRRYGFHKALLELWHRQGKIESKHIGGLEKKRWVYLDSDLKKAHNGVQGSDVAAQPPPAPPDSATPESTPSLDTPADNGNGITPAIAVCVPPAGDQRQRRADSRDVAADQWNGHVPPMPEQPPAWLTVTETALALDLSKSEISKRCDTGEFTSIGHGRARRVDANSVVKYMLQMNERDGAGGVRARVAAARDERLKRLNGGDD